ncbi:hypothetical protein [Micromonospora parathelypteridis]|uniref:Putative secreted protein n=1 Tax=Micromonospora parathelypteridis TaxID=1839617 RepID=A0A840VTT7_9ACTN|nr:hypothetical protein [Micromonospora parathelypteridis]MBB5480047.1 putative secreted protein [Micromonospora parathelypteridis]GGO25298.1 hypothetical protein GCM10011576_47660 [Micromonospora parathelypteridis]
MNVATIVGGLVALFIVAAAFVSLRRRGAAAGSVGLMLRLLAIAATAWIVVALLPFTIDDSGGAASYLLGVPVVAAVCPLIADLTHRAVGVTTTVSALVMLLWGLLLGLGIGLWFVLPALLLGVAAIATMATRHAAVPRNQDA